MGNQEPIKTVKVPGWKIKLFHNRLEAEQGWLPGLKKRRTILFSNIAQVEQGQFTNTTTIHTNDGKSHKFSSRKLKDALMEVM